MLKLCMRNGNVELLFETNCFNSSVELLGILKCVCVTGEFLFIPGSQIGIGWEQKDK